MLHNICILLHYLAQKCRLHKNPDNLNTITYGVQDVHTCYEFEPVRNQCACHRLYSEF